MLSGAIKDTELISQSVVYNLLVVTNGKQNGTTYRLKSYSMSSHSLFSKCLTIAPRIESNFQFPSRIRLGALFAVDNRHNIPFQRISSCPKLLALLIIHFPSNYVGHNYQRTRANAIGSNKTSTRFHVQIELYRHTMSRVEYTCHSHQSTVRPTVTGTFKSPFIRISSPKVPTAKQPTDLRIIGLTGRKSMWKNVPFHEAIFTFHRCV